MRAKETLKLLQVHNFTIKSYSHRRKLNKLRKELESKK